jgi:hypothetical protein
MSLELFGNELLINVFEYLTATEIILAFHSINSRFDSLILAHPGTHVLELKSISKSAVDSFHRHIVAMYSTGVLSRPYTVAIGDFYNDKRLDVVIANFCTDIVETLVQMC